MSIPINIAIQRARASTPQYRDFATQFGFRSKTIAESSFCAFYVHNATSYIG